MPRCPWAARPEIYQRYHDEEWGRPEHDERRLFEKICLEGQQAGLSWLTVLQKRAAYRAAFFDFDPVAIAALGPADLEERLQNPGLIRSRAKLNAIVHNARALLRLHAHGETLAGLSWALVGGVPQINDVPDLSAVPTTTPAAEQLARTLKQRGFIFIGPTTAYAYMQAMGLVDDHLNDCPCKGRGRP